MAKCYNASSIFFMKINMLTFINAFLALLFTFIIISNYNSLGIAQDLKTFSTYSAEDFLAYKKSPFAGAKWDPLVEEGFNAMDRQDMQTTMEFLRKAVASGCRSPLVFFKLALSYEMQGSFYSAIQYYELANEGFKKANQDHRYFKQFNENYGRALYMMGQTDKAIPVLEAASARSENPWVLKILGQVYLSRGDISKAVSYWERFLKQPDVKNNEKIEVNLILARTFASQHEDTAATRYYEQVASLDPANEEAKNYLKERQTRNSFDKVLEMIGN